MQNGYVARYTVLSARLGLAQGRAELLELACRLMELLVSQAEPGHQGAKVENGSLGDTRGYRDRRLAQDEVAPVWWTPTMLLHEVCLLWPRPIPPMRRSFGAKWSSWCVPGVIRPIWLANSNPRPRRSAIGGPRPIGRTAAERQSPLLMPA